MGKTEREICQGPLSAEVDEGSLALRAREWLHSVHPELIDEGFVDRPVWVLRKEEKYELLFRRIRD